jgi:membrane protein DedA with SNARE-associated domain
MKLGPLLTAVLVAIAGIARRDRLTWPVRVVAVIAVVGLLLVGTGLLELPSVEKMVRDVTGALGSLTYVLVGGFAFAESGAFVGLVAPGEIVVVLGGVAAGDGTVALPVLIAIVWACALAGDLLSYAVGKRFGRGILLRHGGGLGITEARLDRVDGFLVKHGAATILVGRFIGLVRALAPFVAGASHMPARRFVPPAVVASGLWSAAFCSLGYAFGQSLDTLIPLIERGSVVLAVLAALTLLVMRLRRAPQVRSELQAQSR